MIAIKLGELFALGLLALIITHGELIVKLIGVGFGAFVSALAVHDYAKHSLSRFCLVMKRY